jgi:hypothetical protein
MSSDAAIAVYFASCHRHARQAAALDVVLGGWGGGDPADRVTFACEVRPSGAMALDAPQTLNRSPSTLGRMLSRDDALNHPWAPTFWQVVDLITANNPDVVHALHGRQR